VNFLWNSNTDAVVLKEEGNVEFIEKRLWQLNSLDPVVKAAWTDELP